MWSSELITLKEPIVHRSMWSLDIVALRCTNGKHMELKSTLSLREHEPSLPLELRFNMVVQPQIVPLINNFVDGPSYVGHVVPLVEHHFNYCNHPYDLILIRHLSCLPRSCQWIQCSLSRDLG